MTTSRSVEAIYRFGPFSLNTTRRLLLRDDEAVPLTSRDFDLLRLLVERPGTVVDKDEILRSVWPGMVVEEGNVTQTVFRLRKALDDAVGGHRFIVTVPKRGCSFVAAVERIAGGAPEPFPAATACAPPATVVPVVSEADRLYLKGRFFWNKRTAEALQKAIGCFRATRGAT